MSDKKELAFAADAAISVGIVGAIGSV